MRFRYEGFTSHGNVKRGYIDAEDQGSAADQLRTMGVFANKLEPDSFDPMKTVLPGGDPLPASTSKSEEIRALNDLAGKVLQTARDIKEEVDFQKVESKKKDWQKDLKDNLAAIAKVSKFCEKNEKMFDDIPDAKFGRQMAWSEAVKQAILHAISKA